MKLCNYILRLVFSLLLVCAVGCESSDSGGDDNRGNGGGGEHHQTWDSSKIDGIWKGKSSSSQVDSTMILSSGGGAVSGSLLWPGDTRSVSGRLRWDNSAVLYIEGGDTWVVSWYGNSMSGTATKPNGNTYPVSFKR